MPAITARAPGKIILFGEHAVVYGRPAIAVPVAQVQARAMVSAEPLRPPGWVRLQAPDIGLESDLDSLPRGDPLALAVHLVAAELGLQRLPSCTLRITSTIPVAAGLGSGAAVSVALVRALSAFLGHPLPDERVSALAYEIEKLHHGTPSGIDNTVITYAMPVYFVRGQPVSTFKVAKPFTIIIGDTGITSPTALAVGDVRSAWQANPGYYESLFDAAGQIAQAARQAIEYGEPEALGPLMNDNHRLLVDMRVSCPELDMLVQGARSAGALGAKLSGGGRGGNMIALAHPSQAGQIIQVLRTSGAVRVLATQVS